MYLLLNPLPALLHPNPPSSSPQSNICCFCFFPLLLILGDFHPFSPLGSGPCIANVSPLTSPGTQVEKGRRPARPKLRTSLLAMARLPSYELGCDAGMG